MSTANLDTLTITDDGWLETVHGELLSEPVPTPLHGCWRHEQIAADNEAAHRLLKRVERGGLDLKGERLYYDFATGPHGERVYVARVGRPVNEPTPRTLTDCFFE